MNGRLLALVVLGMCFQKCTLHEPPTALAIGLCRGRGLESQQMCRLGSRCSETPRALGVVMPGTKPRRERRVFAGCVSGGARPRCAAAAACTHTHTHRPRPRNPWLPSL